MKESNFNIPYPFFEKDGALYKLIVRKDEEVAKFISRNVPYITAKYRDVEFNHIFYEICFKSNNRLVKVTESASVVAKKNLLLNLALRGLNINDNNAKDFIDYFSLYERENAIPVEDTVMRLGYINGEFYHPDIATFKITAENIAYKKILNSIHGKGTLESYRKDVFEKIKQSYVATFVTYTSLSSILLKDFDIEPFAVEISGVTSSGKTTALKLAASVWGRYEDLVMSWNITNVGIERLAMITNSFPLILDDTQKASSQNLINAIYQFSSGIGKVRGSLEGIRNNYTWSNILLSSGEYSMVNRKENTGGASARVITIGRAPFKSIDYTDLYEGLGKSYGTLGVAFQKEYEKNEGVYKELFNEITKKYKMKYKMNDVLSRLVRLVSIIHLAGLILNQVKGFRTNVAEVCETIFEDIIESNKTVNMPEYRLEEVLSVLDTKRNQIQSNNHSLNGIDIIAVNREDYVGVTKNFLNSIIESHEINQLVSDWKRLEYLITDKDRVQKSVKIKTGNGKVENIRVYAIKKEVIKWLSYDFEIYKN